MNSPTIVDSLQISVLGMCVVFIVLILLMVIIYIMSAIIKSLSINSATAPAEVSAIPVAPPASPEPAAISESAPVAAVTAPPVTPSLQSVSNQPQHRTAVKYKVTVNGTAYDVVDGQIETAEVQTHDD